MLTRIAREKTELFEPAAQLHIELYQRSGYTQADGPGLTGYAAAIGKDDEIELIGGLGGRERLPDHGAGAFGWEVLLESAAIDLDLTRTGT
jgi:hypothetical protein